MKAMLPLLIASALLQAPKGSSELWYGPVELHFQLPENGNPYDPKQNDVDVLFTSGNRKETRIAYFDGKEWCVRFAGQVAGTYKATVERNGAVALALPDPVKLSTPLTEPYVRVRASRFALSDGTPFWPMGHSLAWQNGGQPSIVDQLATMGANGVTWTRIWATYWDGRNPYWPQGEKLQDGYYSQSALGKWDALTRAAEKSGVRFQWTLHHHGQVSSNVNPNWPDHPWNAKNGGFLSNAEDFFTDAEAKRRTKAYLRYVVGRYADSPAIMAWELFNEVQFSDASQHNHWDTVAAWHDEMAAYLRSIDPYHHLITTSSEIGKPIWSGTDYYQAHGYPSSVSAMVLGDKFPKDKPYFWGEIGAGNDEDMGTDEHLVVRDGIWSGVLAGNQGSAQYWNWDRMGEPHMYNEYKLASEILHASGFLTQTDLTPTVADLTTSSGADLSFSPGLGWAASTAFLFNLPADASPQAMGKFSSFFQGAAHPDMGKPLVQFHFNAPADGAFSVRISGVSDGGGSLEAYVDSDLVKKVHFSSGSKPNTTWSLPFTAGTHTVTLKNTGQDWVLLAGFSVQGIAPAVTGSVLGNGSWSMLRLKRGSADPAPWSASGLPLADGTYQQITWDLDSGAKSEATVTVTGGKTGPNTLNAKDAIVVFRK